MKNLQLKNIAFLIVSVCMLTNTYGQADTVTLNAYKDLSLKDLLNVKIVSVSKEAEFLFDAPLSASVVTKEEIRRTGCTSIMEALRLVPGMIVREQSNGNYDIHLRGMDNVPPNVAFDLTSNTTTLVMIDNRPIYSYLRGGTFWETLPIDLNDVDKIEVIRGPAAALYGPNAVNGVINIITNKPAKTGLYATANSSSGSLNTFINNASIGFKKEKFYMIASGNYQARDRSQTSYFEFNRNMEVSDPTYFVNFQEDTITNVKQRYPWPSLAMKKYGANIFLGYDVSKNLKFDFSAGTQHSHVQKVSTENEVTPLSEAESKSHYIDFSAKAGKLTARVSYNSGTQTTDYDPGNKYDFNSLDANIEYNYKIGGLSLKPGLSYSNAIYDDTKYSDIPNKTGIFNARGNINSRSASLRGEYKMIGSKLRLTGGLAASKFNYPDSTYMSYELAATYKLNKKNLFRAVYSQAPRSSTIYDTYVDQSLAYFPIGLNKFNEIALKGNKSLKLLTAKMLEIGYRGSITPKLNIDVELFRMHAKNYSAQILSHSIVELNGIDTVIEAPIASTNLPLVLTQHGLTITLNYASGKFQIIPFVTIQKTRAANYYPSENAPDAEIPGADIQNIFSGMGSHLTLKSTPAVFGGAQINYALTSKLNFNASTYYYSAQTYMHISNLIFNDGIRGVDHIPAKLIVNTNLSYEPLKNLYLFCSGKNLLNNKAREFFHTDMVPVKVLTGIHYQL